MKLTTYVNFDGCCAEAFRYYERHLGGTIESVMLARESPVPTPLGPEWADQVLHAVMRVGGTRLRGADIPGAQPVRSSYLTLELASDAEADRVFAALADGGQVLMPVQETFFATRFAQVRDRFGVAWMLMRMRPQPPGA
jgi:PhnB protein